MRKKTTREFDRVSAKNIAIAKHGGIAVRRYRLKAQIKKDTK